MVHFSVFWHFLSGFIFNISQGADAELAVSVQGPVEDIPVKVNIRISRSIYTIYTISTLSTHNIYVTR